MTMIDSGLSPAASSSGLSPMQAGMLFQQLLGEAAGSGFDIEQLHIVLEEEIAPEHLARAFTVIARRHPVLSTELRWDGGERATQHVVQGVVVPIETHDWRGESAASRDRLRDAFLAEDRARGFDLRVAPLMRVTVFALPSGASEIVWTFHHILLDGRSFGPVLREVFTVYEALRRNVDVILPAPPRPYSEYIAWLATLDIPKSLSYFRNLLAGKRSPTPLPLVEPSGRPLPRVGYGELVRALPGGIASALHALAARTSTTPGTVVQAAWAVVLARFTGDDDVVFGATRACRRSALGGDAEGMIGLFINTLPVRVALGEGVTVAACLASLRAQSLALRDHEHTPLVEIHGVSDIPRDVPLFESIVMFENRSLERGLRPPGDPAWANRTFALHEQPSPPLTVTVFDDAVDGVFEIRLLFDGRSLRDEAVARLAESFAHVLASLAGAHETEIAACDLEVVPPRERERIVHEWNATARPFPDGVCIHEPFEERARLQPSAVALACDGEALSYGELDARANRLACALRARGARPGVFVGICLERGIDLVVALLAVAKSGAAYVPLDSAYPASRIAFMVDDARAAVVVTEERHRALFAADAVLLVDGEGAAAIAEMPSARLPRLGTPTDVAYAIFTSGSTGVPKGVVLSHRAVLNTFDWVTRTLGVGPSDRLLFVTSPCFDLSVYDTFGALGAGATVVVATAAQLADPEALARVVWGERITIWDSAPAALARLIPYLANTDDDHRGYLRLAMLSGDWIPLTLPDAIRGIFPRAEVVSLGGATEAAIWSNSFRVGALDPRWTSVPYGRPIQNARYHVLDSKMRPVPVGVAGELYIGGACLADGYLNRAALTAERFVADVVSGVPGERLYKTGDLARYFDDGELEFLGRADFQVKIRGFRVELGEVEAALVALPEIAESLCIAHGDASGQKSLVAYVVPRAEGGGAIDEEAIRRSLAARLPDFMVPSQIIPLEALPLSSNGKIDRKALPAPGSRATTAAFVAATTDDERAMVALWESVLRRAPIGLTDNFFALGGHSLLAVLLVSKARKELGLDIALSQILKHPTVGSLVAALAGSPGATSATHAVGGAHVITLRPSKGPRASQKPPMFLVSGVGGYGFVFQKLGELLGPEQPLHTLQAIGVESDTAPVPRTIEEMAAIYESEILPLCDDGPVILGGYSFGVLIAFELAARLRARGIAVPLLVSFDGFAPGYPSHLPLADRLRAHARGLLKGDGKGRRAYLEDRLTNVKARVLKLLGRSEETVAAIPHADDALDRRLRRLAALLWESRGRYAPSHVLPTELLLIKTEIGADWAGVDLSDPLYGWSPFVRGPIHVDAVPGEHLTMFSDANGTKLAAEIAAHVDRVARAPRGAPPSKRPVIA